MNRIQWDLMRMRQQRKWAEKKEKFLEKYEGVSPWKMTAPMGIETSMVPPPLDVEQMGIPQLPPAQELPPGLGFPPAGGQTEGPVPGIPPLP